jgi:hypothetical protein
MDAVARERQVGACVKNQDYAAKAHEVAASGLEVASFASEAGKESWLVTARYAQETAALEAESARDRLLSLIGSEGLGADLDQPEANRPNNPREGRGAKADAIEWCFRAIAQLARRSARKQST